VAEDSQDRVQLQSNLDQITLVTRDAPLSTVLSMMAQQQGLNVVTGEEVSQRINVTLNNVKLSDALDAILAVHGYTWSRQNNIVTVASMTTDRQTAPSVQGSDLTGLIDLLKSTNDTKTLASPKVAVLNGQQARISVGGTLGYLLTTATNTITLQNVSFLFYGVVLEVTPIITDDGQVLMKVAPQVSMARINATSKLPEGESTEVTTTVLLSEGQAIVIGGLIVQYYAIRDVGSFILTL